MTLNYFFHITIFMLITTFGQFKNLKHGQRIKVDIEWEDEIYKIDNSKVSIDDNGVFYICQNYIDAADTNDKLGYKYSYLVLSMSCLTNLRTLDKTNLEEMEVGDIVLDNDDDERKVLAVCGDAFLPSTTDLIRAIHWYSFQEAKEQGWKFKQETPQEETIVELTREEIADKFNIPVKSLRIKD